MTPPPQASQLVLAAIIVGAGATVQSSVGFGMALLSAPLHTLTLIFGGVVIAAVAMLAFGLPLKPKAPALLGAGLLSGFMGTTSSIGGPPVAIVYQHAKGPAVRGTLAGYFTVGASMSIVALAIVGRFVAALSGVIVVLKQLIL